MVIHYINHNFTDWDSQTKHMNRVEKSIFLDLRSMYFSNATIQNGKIEAGDFDLLCYRLSCNTDEEKIALTKILKDKFKKIGKTYRLAKWDYVIRCIAKKYGHTGQPIDGDMTLQQDTTMTDDVTHDVTGTDRLHDNDLTKSRQQKSNEKKKYIIELLKSVGVKANTRMSIAELTTLCADNNLTMQDTTMTDDVTHDVTGTDNDVTDIDTQNRDITNNHKPNNHKPNNHKPQTNTKKAGVTSETVMQWFDEFYTLYPVHESKGQAIKTWQKIFLGDSKTKPVENPQAHFEKIMAGLNRNLGHIQTQKNRGYGKHPSTWLNDMGWEDVHEVPKPQANQYGGANDPLAVNHKFRPNDTGMVAPNTIFETDENGNFVARPIEPVQQPTVEAW